MQFKTLIHQALANLLATKLRSFLALLGVLIGTSSVVALIYCGQLATLSVVEQMNALGTNLLTVSIASNSHANEDNQQLSVAEVLSLKQRHQTIQYISPVAFEYKSQFIKGHQVSFPIAGSFSSLAFIAKYHIAQGRFFSDLDKGHKVCVIGANVAKDLQKFGVLDPIGKQFKINNSFYQIIGVGQQWPMNFFITVDMNRAIMMPVESLQKAYPKAAIRDVIIGFQPHIDVVQMQNWIQADLHSMLSHARFFFRNPKQLVDRIVAQKRTFTLLLAVIGGIALLVGGIGIMNIMLVSVTERRREIGLRLSIGATARDIQLLFLIEGVVLSFIGGIMGVVIGLGVSAIIAYFAKWHFAFFLLPPFLGFFVSVTVGIFFGYYPAKKASTVDPIVALRDE